MLLQCLDPFLWGYYASVSSAILVTYKGFQSNYRVAGSANCQLQWHDDLVTLGGEVKRISIVLDLWIIEDGLNKTIWTQVIFELILMRDCSELPEGFALWVGRLKTSKAMFRKQAEKWQTFFSLTVAILSCSCWIVYWRVFTKGGGWLCLSEMCSERKEEEDKRTC